MRLNSRKSQFSSPVFEALESRTLLAGVVSIAANNPSASENGDPGQFTISRDVVTNQALRVNLVIAGTAKNGGDYAKTPAYAVIPPNAASVIVAIRPIDDGKTEAAETAVLTIKPASAYAVDPAAPSDTVTIADATYLEADFFPLVDGARWDYNGVGSRTRFHGYTEDADQGGDFLWTFSSNMPTLGGMQLLLRSTADGITLVGDKLPEQDMMYYDPPAPWLPASMQIGTSSSSDGTQDQGGITWSQTLTAVGVETVTVPAGTFRALKVQTVKDEADSNSGSHSKLTMWLVRGVGMVKMSNTITFWGTQSNIAPLKFALDMTSWSVSSQWAPQAAMIIARDQFAGGVIDGKIYVFGGNGNPDEVDLKSLEVYDPAQDLWTQLADNPNNNGDGVEEVTGAVVNGKLYVFGAYGGETALGYGNFNFVQEYDPAADTWTSKAPKPTPVSGAPCAVYNGEIYVFGGEFGYEDAAGKFHLKRYNVVEAYNPATDSWRSVTKMPKVVQQPILAVVGDKAYVLGGAIPSATAGTAPRRFSLTSWAFDFTTLTWITQGLAPLPRGLAVYLGSAAPVVDGKIYVIGGGGGLSPSFWWATNVVSIYDTAANTWSTGPSLPVPSGPLSVVVGDSLYAIGGDRLSGLSEEIVDTVWRLPLP